MEKLRQALVNIIKDKKKLRIFLGTELVIFIMLVSMLIFAIINNNKVVETSEAANIEIEQNEIPEIIEEENDEEEQAQELTEEQQKEAEKEENIEKKDDKQNSNNSNKAPSGYNTSYYIKVNYGANVVTIYTKDEQGNYNPIKAMVCSTGRATPRSGVYTIKNSKHRWGALFGGVWGQYTTQIVGNILFHSVPYLSANPSNLEYWEYDKLGTTASAGCVRLKVCDAKWIYDSIPVGTPVEFYSDSNPGPLGKPGAQKISSNETCRGWDLTDPSGNNPWKNVSQQQEPIPTPQPTPTPTPAPTPAQPQEQAQQNNTQSDTGKTEENKSKDEEPKQNKSNSEENTNPTTENKDKEETKQDDNNENNGSNNEDADKNETQGNEENTKDDGNKT